VQGHRLALASFTYRMNTLIRSITVSSLACALLLQMGGVHARQSSSKVDGLWCGSGLLHEFSLRLAQQQHDVNGTLVRRDRVRELTGRIDGNVLRTQTTKVGALVLEVEGDAMRVIDGEGQLALVRGMSFNRVRGSSCTESTSELR